VQRHACFPPVVAVELARLTRQSETASQLRWEQPSCPVACPEAEGELRSLGSHTTTRRSRELIAHANTGVTMVAQNILSDTAHAP